MRDCFMLAGLTLALETALASNTTAPVTTGDATLVPLRERQPECKAEPRTPLLYVTMSGLARPYPAGSSCHVIVM